MKASGKAESTSDASWDTRAAYQPWIGGLVTMTPSPERFAGDFRPTGDRAPFDLVRPGERVWDAVLALLFVAGSAALGWAGAVWL